MSYETTQKCIECIFLIESLSFCSLPKRKNEPKIFYDIEAGEFQQLSNNVTTIQGLLWYRVLREQENTNGTEEDNSETLWFTKISIEDRKGNK